MFTECCSKPFAKPLWLSEVASEVFGFFSVLNFWEYLVSISPMHLTQSIGTTVSPSKSLIQWVIQGLTTWHRALHAESLSFLWLLLVMVTGDLLQCPVQSRILSGQEIFVLPVDRKMITHIPLQRKPVGTLFKKIFFCACLVLAAIRPRLVGHKLWDWYLFFSCSHWKPFRKANLVARRQWNIG